MDQGLAEVEEIIQDTLLIQRDERKDKGSKSGEQYKRQDQVNKKKAAQEEGEQGGGMELT